MSSRIEKGLDYEIGGPESFLNQKFNLAQTSSKKSLLKTTNAAHFVSTSY